MEVQDITIPAGVHNPNCKPTKQHHDQYSCVLVTVLHNGGPPRRRTTTTLSPSCAPKP